MKIVFISNYFNHYQVTISDELYEACNKEYYFVETSEVPEERKSGGFNVIQRPYLIRIWESKENEERAHKLSFEADVLICTTELYSLPYKKRRLKAGKLTFEYSERLFKRGFLNFFSKTNLINHYFYHTFFRGKPLYKLCASAYVPNDEYAMGAFRGKCYKFGYFPKVDSINIDEILANKGNKIKILWCARFIRWKHPEMVVNLAKNIHINSLNIEINMIGNGELFKKTENDIKGLGLENILHLVGNKSNDDVLEMMKSHHIFILTSDRQEGWGAVVNEAMANGCCVVSSDAVGSVPYLIKNGYNGHLFKSRDDLALYNCIKELALDKECREQLTRNAYKTILEEWSPMCAVKNLLNLSNCLLNNRECEIIEGPCSIALPYYK